MTTVTSAVAADAGAAPERAARRRPTPVLLGAAAVVLLVGGVTVVGPMLAYGSPNRPVGPPYRPPTAELPLGTDLLGRDVLARLLTGGWPVLGPALGATVLTATAGILIGVTTGITSGPLSRLAGWLLDLLVVTPPVLVLLVLATGLPGSNLAVLLAVAATMLPYSARVLRVATRQVTASGYLEVARARGDPWWRLLGHDVLPNIAGPALADAGIRFLAAVALASTAGFLGLGTGAPAANWGQMIAENRDGLVLTPWPVLVPALLLVSFCVAVNLLVDDLAARVAGGAS
jgi:peptide/nickel transport system permease protein